MKISKLLFLFLLLSVFSFSACDKDDDEDILDPDLFGYWVYTFDEEEGKVELNILFFDKDGRGSIEYKIITEENTESETAHFNYSTKNNTLTIDLLRETIEAPYQITGDLLIIDGDEEYTRS